MGVQLTESVVRRHPVPAIWRPHAPTEPDFGGQGDDTGGPERYGRTNRTNRSSRGTRDPALPESVSRRNTWWSADDTPSIRFGYVRGMAPVLPATRRRQHVYDDSQRWSDSLRGRTTSSSRLRRSRGRHGCRASWLRCCGPTADAPAPAFELSPWLDARIVPLDDIIARVDAIPHRRFIKTHSPADCTPIFTECRYLAVYRDGRDVLVSFANHRRKMRPEVIEALNTIAARDGVAPWPPVWDDDMDQLFDEWVDWGTPMEHLASWWPNRHEPFVLLVHYADLIRDLGGEMRRIADFLDVDIPAALWREVVERCRFEAMKSQHEASALLKQAFPKARPHSSTRGRTGGGAPSSVRRNFVDTSNSPPSAFPKMPPCGSSMVPSPWVCCSDFAPTSRGSDGLIWVHPGAATRGVHQEPQQSGGQRPTGGVGPSFRPPRSQVGSSGPVPRRRRLRGGPRVDRIEGLVVPVPAARIEVATE